MKTIGILLGCCTHGWFGDMNSLVALTYLADIVIFTRYFEVLGIVRRAISVVTKRTDEHEPMRRKFGIDTGRLWEAKS
jgi:circadian clock protein KaiC